MPIYDVSGNAIASGNAIMPFYNDEMTDTINKVRAYSDAPALVFPIVTDIHRYSSGITQTFSEMINNISYFAEHVKCDCLINMGDTIDGDQTKSVSLNYAYDSLRLLSGTGLLLIYAQGNHDNNAYKTGEVFDIDQVFKAFYTQTKGVEGYNFSENGTDYYMDFPGVGVRLISINSCNVKRSNTYAYGSSTATWLASALNTSLDVIVIEHLSSISSQVWSNNSPASKNDITSALQTFVNNGGTLIQFCGHSHIDAVWIDPWLCITQVCQKLSPADITTSGYTAMSGYIDELDSPARIEGTYTADAWSVGVYKPSKSMLHLIRFGGGVDRHIHTAEVSPRALTSLLDSVASWSSSNSSVATVSNGVVTGVGSGKCAIIAKDSSGNQEIWMVTVT